jgi:hypothetical protein
MGKIKTFLVTAVLATMMFGAASAASAQVSIGVQIGAPPPPRVVRVQSARPGPDFVWVDGYWYASGRKWKWHEGYWTRAPFAGARWIAPRYEGGKWFDGYWEGGERRIPHDHRWDHDRDRDFDRDRDRH